MVSIVIPAFNEEMFISVCLNSFIEQTFPKKFEVIIVDNGSTDTTIDVVKGFSKKLKIKIVHENRKGRGAARAAGFAKAHGDLILSTDADTEVPPNWVETLVTNLSDNHHVAVTGTCKIEDQSVLTNVIFNIAQPLAMRIYRLIFGHFWLSGFNFGIRKEAYRQAGGFNPDLNIQEDIELSFKVAKVGPIIFLPHIPVTVSGRRYKQGLFKGGVGYLKTFFGYFFFKNPKVILSDER